MAEKLLDIPRDIDLTISLYAKFLITSYTTNLVELSNWLSLEPTFSCKKGDINYTTLPSGEVVSHIRPWSIWEYSTKNIVLSNHISDHLDFLLEGLEQSSEKIQSLLNGTQQNVKFVVDRKSHGISGRMSISSDYLARLARLSHELTVAYITLDDD